MFIFSNLAISLDGKIATVKRGHFPLGTPKDRQEMQRLRRQADAVLMGASSLRAFKGPCKVFGASKQPTNVILSRRLEGISPHWPFFKDPSIRRVLFVSEKIGNVRLLQFKKTSEIIFLPESQTKKSVSQVLVLILKKLGIKRLLVEGGGEVLWEFVKENLIDVYHVTLTPHLLGGKVAPTLVDGLGLPPNQVVNLKLKKIKKIGDELFLEYRKLKKRGL